MVVNLINNFTFKYNNFTCLINFGYRIDRVTNSKLMKSKSFYVNVNENYKWILTFENNSNVAINNLIIPRKNNNFFYYYIDEKGRILPCDFNKYIFNLYFY